MVASLVVIRIGALCSSDHCLCIRLSVPCLTLTREQKGIASWCLAGGKSMTLVTP